MARVFVSGQIYDTEYVLGVQRALIEAGHEITHDWTGSEGGGKLLDGNKAKLDNPSEAARRAVADMQGVIDSDVYILCTSNEKAGKGMYVELGGALALNKTTGKPIIYLLGNMNHMSIFYFDPSVKHRRDVQEIIDEIKKKKTYVKLSTSERVKQALKS